MSDPFSGVVVAPMLEEELAVAVSRLARFRGELVIYRFCERDGWLDIWEKRLEALADIVVLSRDGMYVMVVSLGKCSFYLCYGLMSWQLVGCNHSKEVKVD